MVRSTGKRSSRVSAKIDDLGRLREWPVGGVGEREGTPFGRSSFHYWDGKALVQQTLQSFDSHEVELMERFSMSEDGTKLVCSVELSSGGRTVRHDEEFPVQK